jgi:azurin
LEQGCREKFTSGGYKVQILVRNKTLFIANGFFCVNNIYKTKMKKIALVLITATMFAACSGDDKTTEEATTEEAVVVEDESSTKMEDGVAKVDLYSSDQMKYDKNEITVPAGSKVELTLTHTGTMAVEVMGHNFVLLKQGTDLVAFTTEASKAMDNGYVPAGSDAVLANTELIGGGGSTTITFDAPEAGTYDFICSFPGHYALMKGKFIVE